MILMMRALMMSGYPLLGKINRTFVLKVALLENDKETEMVNMVT